MTNESEIVSELGIPSNASSAGIGHFPLTADSLGNDATMEGLWAMKASEHADIHFNLLCALDPKILRLTPKDDFIYTEFRKTFPNFVISKIVESELKNPEAKEKWRPFCNQFKEEVEDYDFATLLRLDSKGEYSESNTILCIRIQFLCIEIARNREGNNDSVRENFKPKPCAKKL